MKSAIFIFIFMTLIVFTNAQITSSLSKRKFAANDISHRQPYGNMVEKDFFQKQLEETLFFEEIGMSHDESLMLDYLDICYHEWGYQVGQYPHLNNCCHPIASFEMATCNSSCTFEDWSAIVDEVKTTIERFHYWRIRLADHSFFYPLWGFYYLPLFHIIFYFSLIGYSLIFISFVYFTLEKKIN